MPLEKLIALEGWSIIVGMGIARPNCMTLIVCLTSSSSPPATLQLGKRFCLTTVTAARHPLRPILGWSFNEVASLSPCHPDFFFKRKNCPQKEMIFYTHLLLPNYFWRFSKNLLKMTFQVAFKYLLQVSKVDLNKWPCITQTFIF